VVRSFWWIVTEVLNNSRGFGENPSNRDDGAKRVALAFAADQRYFVPMCVAALSAIDFVDANLSDFELALFLDCVGDRSIDAMTAAIDGRIKMRIADCSKSSLKKVYSSASDRISHVSAATNLRLGIARELGATVTRCLYLDSDVLVRRSLAPLWQMPLGGRPLAAVPDPYIRTVGSELGIQAWKECNLRPSTPYFNAGVMLFEPSLWQQHDVEVKALKYLHEYGNRAVLLDQEALNAAVGGNFLVLDSSYNVTNYHWHPESRSYSALKGATIRHFTGPLKPWQGDFCESDALYEYWAYLRKFAASPQVGT
jgi:lipopolysaccharide biosynthesis glycosyltransferase